MKIKTIALITCLFVLFSSFAAGCGGSVSETNSSSSQYEETSDVIENGSDTAESSEVGNSSLGGAGSSSDNVTSSESVSSYDIMSSYQSGSVSSSDNTSSEPYNVINYLPLTASDDGLLDLNPDRGFRTEFVMRIEDTELAGVTYDSRTVFADQSEKEIKDKIKWIFNIYFKSVSTNKTFLAYIYLTDYHDRALTESAKRVVEIFFEVCRERRVKSMLRFCYNWSYAKSNYSEANRKLLQTECADQNTILKHIQQLKPIIGKYSDTIHTISCGFVGYVGEWAAAYQWPAVDYPTVTKAIVENFCVPNDLYFSIRLPEYKASVGKDYRYWDYISYNNDAMFGEQTKKDWESGSYQLGNSNGWWEYVTKVAAYTPQDGEMFVNGNLYNTGRVPSGLEIILECAHHRHSSMSNWHGYMEALSKQNVMTDWKNYETITRQILDRNKIIYDPNWFVDDYGNEVNRNPYDFLKDHLGYKLVATTGRITGNIQKSSAVSFELKLKNYGFAAAFMLESGFAVLDSNYNVVSTVKAGEPDKWYSHDPENYQSTVVLEHSVKADLKLPSESGTYYIAFYLKNTMNDHARLSNKIVVKNGYNILYDFQI